MKELQFGKSLLSGYFFASVFFFFIASNLPPVTKFLTQLHWWIYDVVRTADTQNATADMQTWLPWSTLFLACFLMIFLMKNTLVEPMGFTLPDSYTPPAELVVLMLLVFGSLIFFVNNIFPAQLMPSVTPDIVVKLFGGISESVTRTESEAWSFVPWVWTIGPLIYIYLLHKKYS